MAFVPQQPLSLPAQSEALVIVEETDHAAQDQLDAAVRAYYQEVQRSGDAEDAENADEKAWGKATSPQSHRAWDED